MWKVYDNYGNALPQRFSSANAAYGYIALNGRLGEWKAREINPKYKAYGKYC